MSPTTFPPRSLTAARSRADDLLDRYPAGLPLADLLPRICRDEGIELRETDLRDIAGVLRREGVGWQLTVNRQDAPRRQLFTLAHLLGHYFLHADPGRTFVEGPFVGGCRHGR